MPRRRRLARGLAGLAASALLAGLTLAGTLGTAAAALPAGATTGGPLANPAHNVTPPVLLDHSGPCVMKGGAWKCASPCVHVGDGSSQPLRDTAACTAVAVAGIDAGRRTEGLPPLRLPANYDRLSVPEQLFALVDLERVARGVPPLVGLVASLDSRAEAAALAGVDPAFAAHYGPVTVGTAGNHYRFASTWAGGIANPAAAVFGWVYDDGWGGPRETTNLACTSAHAPGCWGHRDALLGEATGTTCRTCVAGAGFGPTKGWKTSMTFLIVAPVGRKPATVFSWARGVYPYLYRSPATLTQGP